MKKTKVEEQGVDGFDNLPEIDATEIQEVEEQAKEGRQNQENSEKKGGSAMKEKSEESGIICPICKSETPLTVAGKGRGGTKFLVCASHACRKPPFNFTLFFMPSTKAPVLWKTEFGAIHQINEKETA